LTDFLVLLDKRVGVNFSVVELRVLEQVSVLTERKINKE